MCNFLKLDGFQGKWKNMVPTNISTNPVTGVDIKVLRKVGVASVSTPDGVVLIYFNLDSPSPYS
jgi:hypothetical protein